MPIISVKLLKGRGVEQKHGLIRGITETVCLHLAVKPEQVRVILEEMDPDHFGIGGVPASLSRPGTVVPEQNTEEADG